MVLRLMFMVPSVDGCEAEMETMLLMMLMVDGEGDVMVVLQKCLS